MTYINHYSIAFEQIVHKGITLADVVTSQSFQDYILTLDSIPYDTGIIPPGYEHRPDLISDLFYNTTKLDWLILWFNNLDDAFQNLNVGDRILIPKLL
jgi:hypothetical protein